MNRKAFPELRRPFSPAEFAALRKGAVLPGLAEDLRAAFTHGPRAVIVEGLDPAVLGEDGVADALALLGAEVGTLSVQSPRGERVMRVEKQTDNPEARGTLTDLELRPHTDMHDILALASVHTAREGGESMLVNVAELHAELARRHPETLAPLQRGYWFGTNPVLASGDPLSAARVPLIDATHGRPMACYNGYFLHRAARQRGEELEPELAAALETMGQVALELALRDLFVLRPGEAVFWHNWSWLHGRTAFHSPPGEPARLLFRLWLRSDLAGPVHPEFKARAEIVDRDHQRMIEQAV